MNRYNYFSEKAALEQELLENISANGDLILNFYLKNGFGSLAEKVGITEEWQRNLLFDYLVFEKKAIALCVKENRDFFLRLIGEGKGEMIRNVLGIENKKYDKVWLNALKVLKKLFTEKVIREKLFNLACTDFFEYVEKYNE